MEVRRVLLHRTFLAALVLLLALNCFFFLYSQKKNGTLRSYADTYDALAREMQTLPAEERQRVCQSRKDKMMELSDADHLWIWKQENAEKYDAVQQLLAQYDHLLGYEDYLEGVQENAKMLQSVSIFSKPSSTSYKNTIKTAADFARMLGSKVTLGHDLAVTEVFADPFADYSILILMGVCCALFLSERREGLWPMIHAAPAGRMKLCLRRILTLLLAALFGTLVLLGSKILLVIVAVKAAPAYREPKRLDMYTQFYEQKYAAPITDDTLRGLEEDLAQSEGGDRSAAISEIISRAQMLPEGSWIVPM